MTEGACRDGKVGELAPRSSWRREPLPTRSAGSEGATAPALRQRKSHQLPPRGLRLQLPARDGCDFSGSETAARPLRQCAQPGSWRSAFGVPAGGRRGGAWLGAPDAGGARAGGGLLAESPAVTHPCLAAGGGGRAETPIQKALNAY